MKHYSVHGPYEVPTKTGRGGLRAVDTDRLKSFWNGTGGDAGEFGCYVFAMQYGDAIIPFYVGKTAKQRFEHECFTEHKLSYYNEVLAADRRRRPVLLVIRRTRHHRGRPARDIDRMETWLIAQAKSVNPRLKNRSKVRPATWGIAGVIRSDERKPTATAGLLRRAMGIAS